MKSTKADPAIYDRLLAAFLSTQADYVHPEYPAGLLEERLRRFLPHLCFYATPSCVLRPVLRGEYLCIEQILSFGEPSPREVTALVALAFTAARRSGCALLVESFTRERHRGVAKLSEQELQFPIINPAADDPWDRAEACADDPHALGRALLGETADEVDVYLAPLYGYVYFEEPRRDALEIIATLAARTRVLHVSASTHSVTHELHRALGRQSAWQLGAPRINYISTIPRVDALERWVHRARGGEVPIRCLVEGQLHELP